MTYASQPNLPQKRKGSIRFGCGAVLGAVIAAILMAGSAASVMNWVILMIPVALLFGWLVMKYGDPIWQRVASVLARLRGW